VTWPTDRWVGRVVPNAPTDDVETAFRLSSRKNGSHPEGISLRSLMTEDVGGLVLAGPRVTGGFIAHCNDRVTGNAVAAGAKALPHEVPFGELGVKCAAGT